LDCIGILEDGGADMYLGEVAPFNGREPETQIALKHEPNNTSLLAGRQLKCDEKHINRQLRSKIQTLEGTIKNTEREGRDAIDHQPHSENMYSAMLEEQQQ